MPCDRKREINSSKTFDGTIHSEKEIQQCYSESGCASSDVSVRSESESVTTATVALILSMLVLRWQ
jgi:hypothetical protein